MSAPELSLIGILRRQRWGWTARRRLLPEVRNVAGVVLLGQLFA